ncbi:MerR family DNA-binding transcriptional regulator [Oceanobacillus kimchii]|uniref:MerR family DNA-binding transcriptional regulator n=1 Tax=Oceanobacillus kimchii TaxID=746691 RepID=UPI0003482766|nr:MerR family DNA-binding transcriptional regulator [Oceanobacillus kimchii]
MKTYSISEVANKLNLTVYTLRYYDKEGLLPFVERKANVKAQLEELTKTMAIIDHKCDYYKTALDAGTEDIHKNKKLDIYSTN